MPLVTEVEFQSGLGDIAGAAAGASEIQVKRLGLEFHGQGYWEATSEMAHWTDRQTDRWMRTASSRSASGRWVPPGPPLSSTAFRNPPPHSSSGRGMLSPPGSVPGQDLCGGAGSGLTPPQQAFAG